MAEPIKLNHPWLVAVWPGMGHVALNAGVYLLAKLGMTEFAEFEGGDTFDIEAVEVKGGLVQPGRRPRSRFFLWTDPGRRHDLLVFVGEAQPPGGKYAFCRRLVAFAREQGVERVFTFAAMATRMHPEAESRVFGAATDRPNLDELKRLELDVLDDGHIGGLNGVLLSAAAEAGLHGACFLGEMPHIFAQIPFPKASHAILEAFTTLSGIDIDLDELAEQAKLVDQQLGEVLARIEEQARGQQSDDDEDSDEGDESDGDEEAEEAAAEPEPPKRRSTARKRIEELFEEAARDRSKAFELKQELDRLSVFKEYEDRFLDLFKKAE
ncbi:Marine sediment metagenome DNA, contig: S03H2_C02747 OS=marine sediment metagenome GN=S03H2_06319 PE=4 SV=1: PAC2 [Gemmataceae bacterium]|nr:Marine sediment metagenome DNA, contig: S03H2_C02747 OS=marine sediment metagenome GN=S03H2_06319 PE=4 SV=1: PAC2 [Gemmataceae bacterium]VTU00087.1 Marine sediment metagenome DNA, contig: S03H2_C02747 OS=marine sediment metagenome GN=S03H2_06319 PE=4 SV=1: PAC2 [Gemmataceae bacterium]